MFFIYIIRPFAIIFAEFSKMLRSKQWALLFFYSGVLLFVDAKIYQNYALQNTMFTLSLLRAHFFNVCVCVRLVCFQPKFISISFITLKDIE